jgi:hypothetical protein
VKIVPHQNRQKAVRRRACLAGALVALGRAIGGLSGPLLAGGAGVPIAKEHEVKAAFVYNFFKFVEWPSGRVQETKAPFVIGVVGKGNITTGLESTVRERDINGHPLIVKTVETPEAARTVHLLFICAAEDNRLVELLPTLAGSGVLTVGESEAFAQQGGIITFVREGETLRFVINMDSAERAGLKISAQLQKLAKTIRRTE